MEIFVEQISHKMPENVNSISKEHINLKNTQVCCVKAPNSLGLHKLVGSMLCSKCDRCLGISHSQEKTTRFTPRLICGESNSSFTLLDFYTHCCLFKRCVKISKCAKNCVYYQGFDLVSARVKCSKPIYNNKRPSTSVIFQKAQILNLNFPFEYPCPIKGKSNINICLESGCTLFKGIQNYSRSGSKVHCIHKNAIESEYVTIRKRKVKTIKPPQKKNKIFDLSFLFEDPIKTKKIGIAVDCLGAERKHYSHSVNVNCIYTGLSIGDCRLCPEHLGIKGFRIQCNLYPTAIFVPHCPHGKGATHRKGGQVSLQTCAKCPQFVKIEDDKVHCRYTKLQGYISNPPRRVTKISRLTHREKEKLYIDIPD